MNDLKKLIAQFLPAPVLQTYHLALAYLGAFLFAYPSKRLRVIAVTGTKGKSSTTEFINAIFEQNGEKTALLNSIRFKIGEDSEPNLLRMSMPGRFFIQEFLSDAVKAGCTTAILEMTSEGARQFRHRAIELDALVFTNLAPEHIESHGSYEAYADAKFEIGKQLARSKKNPRVMVANGNDAASVRYLALPVEKNVVFSLANQEPYGSNDSGGFFTFEGEKFEVKLPGEFSLENALAAAQLARAFLVPTRTIRDGIAKLDRIPGRAEEVDAGQPFRVVVDYAHTPESLAALYKAYGSRRKICVLGSTGGGRDTWKRPVMGKIADGTCETVILTNEDPYDEDPQKIVEQVESGMARKPLVIMDRRAAIGRAIELAKGMQPFDSAQGDQNGIAVLITGKGTDPCICVEHGKKIPWSDAQVAREEIQKAMAHGEPVRG